MALRRVDGRGVIALPATMVAFHGAFMGWVLSAWSRALDTHGFMTGREATLAQTLVEWLDFAVYPLCVSLEIQIAQSQSPLVARVLETIGVDQITAFSVKVLWPLLVVAGSVQWLSIGLGINGARRWLAVRESGARDAAKASN
jgi:hypothetical protein